MGDADSSKTMEQLKTLASYAFLVVAGAYWGYQFAGPFGAVAGAVLIIPIGLFLIITFLLGIAWIIEQQREEPHGT